jgi:hypothetical protein
MKKRIVAIVMAILFLLSLACEDTRVVVDEGGVSTERDVMIYEAGENTRHMDADNGAGD